MLVQKNRKTFSKTKLNFLNWIQIHDNLVQCFEELLAHDWVKVLAILQESDLFSPQIILINLLTKKVCLGQRKEVEVILVTEAALKSQLVFDPPYVL